METKSFVKVLRKVIREEVRSAVTEILQEQKASPKKVINHGLSLQKMVEQQENPPKARKSKKFSKNQMLNDILNETAESSNFSNMHEGPMVGQDEWPSMGGINTSDQASSFASMMSSRNMPNTVPSTDVNGNVVDKESLPEHLTSALTKDYSAVMKAIDKKKGVR